MASPSTPSSDRRAFGGPVGALAMMLLLPLLTVYLWACVHHHGGALVLPTRELLASFPAPTLESCFWVAAWIAFQLALDLYLPGRAYTGLVQRNGRRLTYRLNGLLSLVVTLGVFGAFVGTGVLRGSAVHARLGSLLVTSIVFSFLFSAFLYLYGRRAVGRSASDPTLVPQPDGTAAVSASVARLDELAYDYFMGVDLNPRIGRLDLKMFFESKIGMTTWLVLTLSMAHAQYERDGSLSLSMWLVCLCQLVYVVDFYWFEEAMLSTWDINNENYGWMLAFGFIVWMPFVFSLQAQYLFVQTPELSTLAAAAIVVLNFAGYYIFRSANLQKHWFRTRPDTKIWGRTPAFIQTRRGTRLLTSGWWGLARHANYLGDLMMAFAWCLPCGFTHIIPYFYVIYFTPLLIDRERRDDRHCAAKYGEDWRTYTKQVPYRIIPFVY